MEMGAFDQLVLASIHPIGASAKFGTSSGTSTLIAWLFIIFSTSHFLFDASMFYKFSKSFDCITYLLTITQLQFNHSGSLKRNRLYRKEFEREHTSALLKTRTQSVLVKDGDELFCSLHEGDRIQTFTFEENFIVTGEENRTNSN